MSFLICFIWALWYYHPLGGDVGFDLGNVGFLRFLEQFFGALCNESIAGT